MSKFTTAPTAPQAAAPAAPPPAAYGAAAMTDLEPQISWGGSEVINAVKKDSLPNCLKQVRARISCLEAHVFGLHGDHLSRLRARYGRGHVTRRRSLSRAMRTSSF
jgi:hypothetical protein